MNASAYPDQSPVPAPPRLARPPQRVVSLMPSTTASLFDLGLGDKVVGITDYCSDPPGRLSHLPRLGGPKNPHIADLIALQPELVLMNWEENTRQGIEALQAARIPVWVTFPQTVRHSLDFLWALAGLFENPAAVTRIETLERMLDWVRASAEDMDPIPYFCPIWFEPEETDPAWWMTFNRRTYCHDILAILGGENIFAERSRRYPLAADLSLTTLPEPVEDRDTRYPRIAFAELAEVMEKTQAEVILLPNDPFHFTQRDVDQLASLFPNLPAVRKGRIYLVDGRLVTWQGTALARALRDLPNYFSLT